MKKAATLLLILLSLLVSTSLQSQVLIAKWTFPTGNPTDSLADGGLAVNLSMGIHTEGGTSSIDFSKNGATTKSAQATGWDNGSMTKSWVIHFNTVGYDNLNISSKQQSGGNNPGPRDYVVQYRIGSSGIWADVPNSTIVTANDWNTGVINDVPLPVECNNQPVVYLRWVMTTNTNSSGGTVAASGIDKIDDIYINGLVIVSVAEINKALEFSLSPNPSHGEITVTSPQSISTIELMDYCGRVLHSIPGTGSSKININTGTIAKGSYLLRVTADSGSTSVKTVILQ